MRSRWRICSACGATHIGDPGACLRCGLRFGATARGLDGVVGQGPLRPQFGGLPGWLLRLPESSGHSSRKEACPSCGAPLASEESFCTECGARVDRTASAP